MKKTTNGSKNGIVKNTLIGVGIIAGAVALIGGVIVLAPVLAIITAVILQIGGWIVLFLVAIVLPAWGIGKVYSMRKNKSHSAPKKSNNKAPSETFCKTDLDEEELKQQKAAYADVVIEEVEDEEEEIDYKALYEKEKAANLKRYKRKEFTKKLSNVKSSISALFK